ncbi:MAG: hypothetical protein AAF763_11025, partial [Pseudomonadota bacterium]
MQPAAAPAETLAEPSNVEQGPARERGHLRLAADARGAPAVRRRRLADASGPWVLAVPAIGAAGAVAAFLAGSAALAVLLAGAAVGCGAVLLRRRTAAQGLAGQRAAARAFETLRARIDEPRVLCDGLGRLIAANPAFRDVAGSVAEDGWLERSLQADP